MEDAKAVLHNHEFHPVADPVPAEIADLIILDGLEEIVAEEPEQEPEVVVHPAAPFEVPVTAFVPESCEEKPASPTLVAKPKAVPKKSERDAKKATPSSSPKVYPTVSKDLLRLKKTRLILAMLKEGGFTREIRGGRHPQVADLHGRIIPVPERDEQCPRTVRSMYKLATAPLRFLDKEERK